MLATIPRVHTATFSEGVTLWTAPANLENTTFVIGSVDLGLLTTPQERLLSEFLTELLDAGTKVRSKRDIQLYLDKRGAQLDFYTSGRYVLFEIRCLTEDLKDILALVEEILMQPTFPANEVKIAKKRIASQLHQSKENTQELASIALSRLLYPAGHVNARSTIPELERALSSISRRKIVAYWNKAGKGPLHLVMVGALEPHIAEKVVKKTFGAHTREPIVTESAPVSFKAKACESKITIPHKTNIDIYLGCRTGIAQGHPDEYPLLVLMNALGSDFSARLFQEVREKRGLTYGIYSRLEGMGDGVDGHWSIWATFGPTLLQKGLEAIGDVLTLLQQEGLTAQEIALSKQKMFGRFLIDLSVPTEFAYLLHRALRSGKAPEQLETWQKKVAAVTDADIERVLRTYMHPQALARSMAGTFK